MAIVAVVVFAPDSRPAQSRRAFFQPRRAQPLAASTLIVSLNAAVVWNVIPVFVRIGLAWSDFGRVCGALGTAAIIAVEAGGRATTGSGAGAFGAGINGGALVPSFGFVRDAGSERHLSATSPRGRRLERSPLTGRHRAKPVWRMTPGRWSPGSGTVRRLTRSGLRQAAGNARINQRRMMIFSLLTLGRE